MLLRAERLSPIKRPIKMDISRLCITPRNTSNPLDACPARMSDVFRNRENFFQSYVGISETEEEAVRKVIREVESDIGRRVHRKNMLDKHNIGSNHKIVDNNRDLILGGFGLVYRVDDKYEANSFVLWEENRKYLSHRELVQLGNVNRVLFVNQEETGEYVINKLAGTQCYDVDGRQDSRNVFRQLRSEEYDLLLIDCLAFKSKTSMKGFFKKWKISSTPPTVVMIIPDFKLAKYFYDISRHKNAGTIHYAIRYSTTKEKIAQKAVSTLDKVVNGERGNTMHEFYVD